MAVKIEPLQYAHTVVLEMQLRGTVFPQVPNERTGSLPLAIIKVVQE